MAKAKLKEIRALFNNFTYRRRVSRDAEERQKFSERIIVLLLTVDAIEVMGHNVLAYKHFLISHNHEFSLVVDCVTMFHDPYSRTLLVLVGLTS